MTEDRDRLALDYQTTVELFKTLADIRFRLLALVPAIAGTALALLDDAEPETQLAVGLLGFTATLGILIYELRNSQMYNWAVHRARYIERRLRFERSALGSPTPAGVFGERPRPSYRLAALVTVKHDRGLALVYGAATAGWSFLIVRSGLDIAASLASRTDYWIALGAAALAGGAVAGLINRHDRTQSMPVPVDDPDAVAARLGEAAEAILGARSDPALLEPRIGEALTLLDQVDVLGFDPEGPVPATHAVLRQTVMDVGAELAAADGRRRPHTPAGSA